MPQHLVVTDIPVRRQFAFTLFLLFTFSGPALIFRGSRKTVDSKQSYIHWRVGTGLARPLVHRVVVAFGFCCPWRQSFYYYHLLSDVLVSGFTAGPLVHWLGSDGL
jgi:hypothetical protein